jgi:hypothetical protein
MPEKKQENLKCEDRKWRSRNGQKKCMGKISAGYARYDYAVWRSIQAVSFGV